MDPQPREMGIVSAHLDKVKKWVYNCIKCSNCKWLPIEYDHLKSCPAGSKFKFETYYGSGKIWIAKSIIEGTVDFTDSVVHKIFACPTCGNCEHICGMEVSSHMVEIFEALRAAAVEAGKGPLDNQKVFKESIDANNNPYREPHEARVKWLGDLKVKNEADILYFVGCTSSYRRNEIASNTVKIFNKIGVDFAITPNEWCCGSPLLRTGQIQRIKDLVEHNINVVKEAKSNKIVTSCAGCYKTLHNDYPKQLGRDLDFEVEHITDFLIKLVKDGKLKITKEIKAKVTYHDPCHIGRHSGIYDSPRELIELCPGVEFIEMPRNKESA
ncbi:MAG: (Fe-S)-binding protein, partial [Candidatus Helarchaeota archaeon]